MADQPASSIVDTARDIGAGAVGGVAQVLIGQPFDIVKVRLQTASSASQSAVGAASQIWKNEGPAAFYKGTLTPLIGIGACVSVQFGAFHWARRALEDSNASGGHDRALSYGQYYLAGAFAGIANSVLSGPIEHVRVRLQTQPHGPARLYAGPADCVRIMSRQSGGVLPALFRGQTVTVAREAQAYGVWFTAFEYLMNRYARSKKIDRKDVPTPMVALFGGLAGEGLWIGSYPFDVVKSKMQTDGFGPDRKYPTTASCFKHVWKTEGFAGFWRGIGPTLLRAMPVSAGTFAV